MTYSSSRANAPPLIAGCLALIVLGLNARGGARGSVATGPPTPTSAQLQRLGEQMFPKTEFGYYVECTLANSRHGAPPFDYQACPITSEFRARVIPEQVMLVPAQNPSGTREVQAHASPGGGTVRVIAAAATHFGGHVVQKGEGVAPGTLNDAVLHGHPAVVWVTYHWGTSPRHDFMATDGRRVPYAGTVEHAVTLVGVRPDSVWVNDPLTGLERISRAAFEASYHVSGDMGVVLD